jgi:hypothetical protein
VRLVCELHHSCNPREDSSNLRRLVDAKALP